MSWIPLGAAGISALGSLGASAMNANSASASSMQGYKYSKALQYWQATELPRLQKQGLIDAGYNPILAVNSGHMPIGGTISAQSAHYENPFGSIGSLARDSAEVRKSDATIENLENTNELISANTAKAEAEAKTQEALQVKALSEARAVEQNIQQNAPNAKQAKVISEFLDNPNTEYLIRRRWLNEKDPMPKNGWELLYRGFQDTYNAPYINNPKHNAKSTDGYFKELKDDVKRSMKNPSSNYNKVKKYSNGWLPTGR